MGSESEKTGLWARIISPSGAGVLTIVGLALGVLGLISEKQPGLQFTMVSLSRVFDLHQPIGGLTVAYGGQDLRAAHKALWSVSATLSNPGSAGIKRGDFDDRIPLTIGVANGVIVDEPSITGSSDYLNSSIKITKQQSELVFESFILDAQDSIRVSFIVLSPDDSRPEVRVHGKIAGVKSIEQVPLDAPEPTAPVWKKILGADAWWVQILRGVVYSIFFIGVIIIGGIAGTGLLSPIQKFRERRTQRERKNKISGFNPVGADKDALAALAKLYVDKGNEGIAAIFRAHLTFSARASIFERLQTAQIDEELKRKMVKRCFPALPTDYKALAEQERQALFAESKHGNDLTESAKKLIIPIGDFVGLKRKEEKQILFDFWKSIEFRHMPAEIVAYTIRKGLLSE